MLSPVCKAITITSGVPWLHSFSAQDCNQCILTMMEESRSFGKVLLQHFINMTTP